MNILKPIQEEMQDPNAIEKLAEQRLAAIKKDQEFSAPQPEGDVLTDEERKQQIIDELKEKAF